MLLVGGLLLSACGTQSMSTAMRSWTKESTYGANNNALLSDVQHSARALRTPSEGTNDLHTVCGVLLYESEEANAALPTPDDLANTLLSARPTATWAREPTSATSRAAVLGQENEGSRISCRRAWLNSPKRRREFEAT